MTAEELILRRAIVFLSGVIYWAGVWLQARRIRKRIGRSPNVKPRGTKEKLLWAGWFLVVIVWVVQPWMIRHDPIFPALRLTDDLLTPLGLSLATLWCYSVMGSAWRMGINEKEKNSLVTQGPYRSIRHPIYLFQIIMLAGAALLLPTLLSLLILLLHLICVLIKAADEESYLLTVHGQQYSDYLSRTGRLFPKLLRRT